MRAALLLAATLAVRAQSPDWEASTAGFGLTGSEGGILLQLQEIDQELTRVRIGMLELEERAQGLEATRVLHAEELATADARLAKQRAEVGTQLSTLYRLHRRGLARVVFGADDPAELRRRATYLMAIIQACDTRMSAYLEAVAARRDLVLQVDRDMGALEALRAELQLKESELEERRTRRVALLDQIRSQRDLAARAMDEYGAVRSDLGGRMAGGSWGSGWTGASSVGAAPAPAPVPVPRAAPAGNGTFRSAAGHLPWPTTGRVVRSYGPYTDARTGQAEESRGLDLAADYGTPVRAVFEGQVKLADYVPGYGQTVAIEHGPYTTVYAHLSGLRVQPGQAVRAGDVLGLVGNSGLTDGGGYMLTFEIRYNGTPQDPSQWLSRR